VSLLMTATGGSPVPATNRSYRQVVSGAGKSSQKNSLCFKGGPAVCRGREGREVGERFGLVPIAD